MNKPEDALQEKLSQLSPAQREALLAKLKQRKSVKPRQDQHLADKPVTALARDKAAYPLSFAQKRLWFLEQLDPGNPAYNIAAAINIKGMVNADVLEQTFQRIIQRHESLRTRFQQDNNGPYQVPHDGSTWKLDTLDLRGNASSINEHIHLEANTPFELHKDMLLRARLFQTGDSEYVLTIVMHHIISDAWSSQVLLAEVSRIYPALLQGAAVAMPAPKIQYLDFAHWQEELLNDELVSKQLDFWKQQLAGYENLNLYTSKPRPSFLTHNGNHHRITINHNLLEQLEQLCRKKGTTLFNGLLTLLQALLHRYTQQKDFCIGIPVSGRHYPGVEPLIGFFVNTLAIKSDIDERDSFLDLLEKVKSTSLEAQAHADIPFEQLVDEIAHGRDSSISPIFQVLFSHNPGKLEEQVQIPGLDCTFMPADLEASKYEISLITRETEDGLNCHFEYNSDLFTEDMIERLSEHFIQLLKLVIDEPRKPLDALALFTCKPLVELLGIQPGGVNQTQQGLPDNCLVHQHIETQVSLTPDNIAVSDDKTRLDYKTLNARSNQLAHYLIAQGAKPGDIIGVCLKRSINMTVSLLGILKAGCAYVPFDPDFPQERLEFMAKDTDINILLADKSSLPGASSFFSTPTCVDTVLQDQATGTFENPTLELGEDALFNIIYTSGSTGNPKGVMVPHKGIFNRLQWMQDTYPLTANDRILQKTPYSFDVSVWELFWPLMIGSSYHFLAPDEHRIPEKVRDAIITHDISVVHFVPSMLGNYLGMKDNNNCKTLRRVFCSGEALLTEHVKQFYHVFNNAELVNLYGPTEASIDVSHYVCKPDTNYASVPIGKPISNTQLHVLDKHLRPLPPGIIGELYIGGTGLASAYLNRKELTEKSFIDNPYHEAGHPSPRLYKTGDLACWNNEGQLIYLGRNDHQVKIRGNRIELGEIETRLKQMSDISEAVVVPQTINGQVILVAFLCTDELQAPHYYKQSLKQFLPEFMIPTAYCAIEQLPLSANGKIDRKKLPQIETGHLHKTEYVAPATPVEKSLADIWQTLLDIERIGVHDNFFELGGHSLLATTLLTRIREHFHIELPLKTIFEVSTIEGLAKVISAMSTQASDLDADDEEDFEEGIL